MISPETASKIWNCHREISVAQKLEDDIATALAEGEDPTPLNEWGRRADFQLGVPTGNDRSHRLYKVAPRLALSIIRAHVAEKKSELVSANEQARLELEDANANTGEERHFILVVNGRQTIWDRRTDRVITYTQLIELAGFHEESIVSVTYHGKSRQGILSPRETVEVEDGMIFNAQITDKA